MELGRTAFLNTNRTNKTNVFGTRIDTDEHGFTVRRITLFILPQMSDEHRFGIFKGGGITKTIKTPNCIFRKPLALHSLLYFSAREQALFHRLTANNVAEHTLLPENTVGR